MHPYSRFALIAPVAALSLVGGCGQGSAPSPSATFPASRYVVPPAPASTDTAISVLEAPRPAPEQVLALWGQAIEARDWRRVRALWGDHGAASGLSEAAFAARWAGLITPRVTIGPGQQEGAAGSIFYTVPVEVRDGTRKFGGILTIRRANDVEGASAEQLRWHLDATMRAPWTAQH